MIDVTPVPPSAPPPRSPRSRLLPGIVLMLVGAWLLAANLGWSLPYSISSSIFGAIPLFFIGVGIVGLSFPSRHVSRSRGAWLLGVGIYLACGFYHVLGLSWGTAWPIVIIGGGLAVMLSRDDLLCDRGRRRSRVIHGA